VSGEEEKDRWGKRKRGGKVGVGSGLGLKAFGKAVPCKQAARPVLYWPRSRR
jgi:hypothetical protein